jgi:hypothetical protein
VIAKRVETQTFTNVARAATDRRIQYPSYRSFDQFIDVERLRSLDGYIARQIRRHIEMGPTDFFVNEHRLDELSPYRPGVREIWLTRTAPGVPYNYLDLDRSELWVRTPECEPFTLLMEFVDTLPFQSTGRILIIFDDAGKAVPAHRDHESTEICNEFIWMRTNLRKPFYMLDQLSGEKLYVDSYSAWFDAVNQFHGSDAGEGLTFSIRVDGHFTDEFRRTIPRPEINAASTPSLWASIEENV